MPNNVHTGTFLSRLSCIMSLCTSSDTYFSVCDQGRLGGIYLTDSGACLLDFSVSLLFKTMAIRNSSMVMLQIPSGHRVHRSNMSTMLPQIHDTLYHSMLQERLGKILSNVNIYLYI